MNAQEETWLADIIRSLEVGLDRWENTHITGPGTWTYKGADGPMHELMQSTVRRLKDFRDWVTDSPPTDT